MFSSCRKKVKRLQKLRSMYFLHPFIQPLNNQPLTFTLKGFNWTWFKSGFYDSTGARHSFTIKNSFKNKSFRIETFELFNFQPFVSTIDAAMLSNLKPKPRNDDGENRFAINFVFLLIILWLVVAFLLNRIADITFSSLPRADSRHVFCFMH